MTKQEYIKLQVDQSIEILTLYGVPSEHIMVAEKPGQIIIAVKSEWINSIKKDMGRYTTDTVALVYHDFHAFEGVHGEYAVLVGSDCNCIDRRLVKAIDLRAREVELENKDKIDMDARSLSMDQVGSFGSVMAWVEECKALDAKDKKGE